MSLVAPKGKPYRGLAIEGMLATWHARNTAKSLAEFAACAKRIAQQVRIGHVVLGIAAGPGCLSVALTKLGASRVTRIAISGSFVRIARGHALGAGAAVDFREGDAAALPFTGEPFDFVV